MSVATARKMRWSEEDYLRMEADSAIKHEFLDGEVYAMAGAKPGHNAVCGNVLRVLGNLVHGGSCGTFTSDQRIYVPATGLYTYADGGIACGKWELHGADEMALLNPVLLFEVLSPSTREYDRGSKLAHYLQIPSLHDVLLIDQPEHLVEHHHRGHRGWKLTTRHRGGIPLLGGTIQIEDDIYYLPGL